MNQYVIYTDLDGTLLSIYDYSFEYAEEAIHKLQQNQVPLIFCSTKTFAEQVYYQKELKIYAPFIAENGSAIFIPKDYFPFSYSYTSEIEGYHLIELGKSAQFIRQVIREVNKKLGLNLLGFNDLPIDELERLIGLQKSKIERALAKSYTKTLVNSLTEKEVVEINKEICKYELVLNRGSKYYSVMSIDVDKGKAIKILNEMFSKKYNHFISVGIGDGINDLPMFHAVDSAYLVQRYKNFWEEAKDEKIKLINGVNTAGFVEVINILIGIT